MGKNLPELKQEAMTVMDYVTRFTELAPNG